MLLATFGSHNVTGTNSKVDGRGVLNPQDINAVPARKASRNVK